MITRFSFGEGRNSVFWGLSLAGLQSHSLDMVCLYYSRKMKWDGVVKRSSFSSYVLWKKQKNNQNAFFFLDQCETSYFDVCVVSHEAVVVVIETYLIGSCAAY